MTDFKELREALDAGPTEGPWVANSDGVAQGDNPHRYRIVLSANIMDEQRKKDCHYIAVANPATIRALLSELDAARKDAGRWRALSLKPDEVLVALRRGEDYEDVHPELISEDAIGDRWPEYRTIDAMKEQQS